MILLFGVMSFRVDEQKKKKVCVARTFLSIDRNGFIKLIAFYTTEISDNGENTAKPIGILYRIKPFYFARL